MIKIYDKVKLLKTKTTIKTGLSNADKVFKSIPVFLYSSSKGLAHHINHKVKSYLKGDCTCASFYSRSNHFTYRCDSKNRYIYANLQNLMNFTPLFLKNTIQTSKILYYD